MSTVSLTFSTNHRFKPVVYAGNLSCSAISKTMQTLYSHQERPIHGDIKPANILFSPPQEVASAVLVSEDEIVTEENESENRMGLPPQPRGHVWICDRCSATAAEAASMAEFSPEVCVQHSYAADSQAWGSDESIDVCIPFDRGLENSGRNSTERRSNGWSSFRCDSCTLEKSSSSFTSLGNETLDEAPY